MDSRAETGDFFHECNVEALVEHAVKAGAGMGNPGLVRRIGQCAGGQAEVGDVDRARECVDVAVLGALGLVQTHTAGEDHVGALEQLPLTLAQFGRRAQKAAQLIHAVVHRDLGCQFAGEPEGHRSVIPAHVAPDREFLEKLGQQLALESVFFGQAGAGGRQMRPQHP